MNNATPPANGQDDARYARGEGGRTRRQSLRPLEWLTAIHLGTFAIAASWAFGGQADWVRGPLVAWGSLSGIITLAVALEPHPDHSRSRFSFWWATPIVLFNLLVLIGTLHPSFREVRSGTDTMLVNQPVTALLPSSARPLLARQSLWAFDAIWLSCFNFGLVVRRRRTVRLLLLALSINAVSLAVFGTVQKLAGSSGLYFGAVPSPQKYFFASFVYHNHWGAYIVLMLAAGFALLTHYVRRHEARDFFHSPALMGGVVALLLLVTIPLSSSRSCTIVAGVLVCVAFVRWLLGVFQRRRHLHESVAPPIILAITAAAIGAYAIWSIARDTFRPRIELTVQQIAHARTASDPDARMQLYRDTWRMGKDKPVFGWGMASYPYVFTGYNSREAKDKLPVFYHDAHSDWLQAVAEHGFVGTILLVLAAAIPLFSAGKGLMQSSVTGYLLLGCALIVVYAAVEFPFGNFAVVLTWWLCFYAAVHYARLTGSRNQSTA